MQCSSDVVVRAAKSSARPHILLTLALFTAAAHAQNEAAAGPACPDAKIPSTYQTFYLAHTHDQNQFTEIQSDLRNMLQNARINGIQAQYAISVCGTTAELQLAQKIVTDLDRPHKTWRVTYTFTQTDNGQRAGSQHISLIVASGERSDLKQGNRVPIVTGITSETSQTNSQVQYLDVGLNITANVDGTADSLQLHTKIEQSSIADEKSGIGTQDPIVHQTVLEGTSKLTPGKPVVLGSLDIPGTTRHEEVEVTVEPIP
jgi:type II secretory pathway component GspD/PulD (secretin)